MTVDKKTGAPKRNAIEDEGSADELKPVTATTSGLLSTGLSRALVICSVLFVSFFLTPLLVAHRYVLVSVPQSENALVFRLDSLTGNVSLCTAARCMAVLDKEAIGTP